MCYSVQFMLNFVYIIVDDFQTHVKSRNLKKTCRPDFTYLSIGISFWCKQAGNDIVTHSHVQIV